MNRINFQVLEDRKDLLSDLTRETWFITTNNRYNPIRRELYKINGESVIAWRDTGVDVDDSLYVEERFLDFFKNEPEFETILNDQGISEKLVKLFRME